MTSDNAPGLGLALLRKPKDAVLVLLDKECCLELSQVLVLNIEIRCAVQVFPTTPAHFQEGPQGLQDLTENALLLIHRMSRRIPGVILSL